MLLLFGLMPLPTLLLGPSSPRATLRRAQPARAQLSAAAMYKPPPPGALVEGKIVTCVVIGPAPEPVNYSYLVDIGMPQPALLPAGEVCLLPNATRGQGYRKLEPGEVYEGQILGGFSDDAVNVSLARVQRSVAWKRVQQIEEEDVTYNATVLMLSDDGATVAVEQLPAFVPWSHWHLPGGTPGQPPAEPDALLGSELPVKFLEVDPQRRTLVASNRRVQLQSMIAELSPGMVVGGRVTALKGYGALVRLDESGVDGLLHISQISQGYVRNVSAILAVGDAVRCVVLKVDADDGSVALSTKRLESRPGEMLNRSAAAAA